MRHNLLINLLVIRACSSAFFEATIGSLSFGDSSPVGKKGKKVGPRLGLNQE